MLALMATAAVAAVLIFRVAPAVEPTIILEKWNEDADTFLLVVPDDCPAQTLSYRVWQKTTGPAGIQFVISKWNEPVTATGRMDYEDYTESSVRWTLAPTTYALNVRGVNSRWRLAVACD